MSDARWNQIRNQVRAAAERVDERKANALSLYHLKVSVAVPDETRRHTATVGVVTATRTDAAVAVLARLREDGYLLPVVKHMERVCAGPVEWTPGVPCVYGVTE